MSNKGKLKIFSAILRGMKEWVEVLMREGGGLEKGYGEFSKDGGGMN